MVGMSRLKESFHGTSFLREKLAVPKMLAKTIATRLVALAMLAPSNGSRIIRVTADPPPAMTFMKADANPARTNNTPVIRSRSTVKCSDRSDIH